MKTSSLTLVGLLAVLAVVSISEGRSLNGLVDTVTGAVSGVTGNNGGLVQSVKPTIDGLKRPKGLTKPLIDALAGAPDDVVEAVTNLVAAASQLTKKNLTDDILDEVTDLLKGLDDGLIEQVLKIVENLLKSLSSNRPKPAGAAGCNILYVQLRAILLRAIDLDVDDVCL